jgi:hypothetical protein
MKGKASEFVWWVPDFGFAFERVVGPPYMVNHPDGVYLRTAISREDASRSLSVEDVSHSLKNWVENPLQGWFSDHSHVSWSGPDESVPGRLYAPLRKHTGLFRSFAAAKPDAEGFLEFANKYGNLADYFSAVMWHREVIKMREALRVWDYIRKEDWNNLSRHFTWITEPYAKATNDENKSLVYDSHPHLPQGKKPPFPDVRRIEFLRYSHLPFLTAGSLAVQRGFADDA